MRSGRRSSVADLFDDIPDEISPELRKELMDLATAARSLAARIDVIVQRKKTKDLDENSEPTFRYNAKVAIPKEFFLTKRLAHYAAVQGMNTERIKTEFDAFVRYYNKTGRKWQDWSRVWMDWVRNSISRQKGGTVAMTTDRMKTW